MKIEISSHDWPTSYTRSLEDELKNIFGYDEFRGDQKAIIETVIANRDVLCILPTGAGKSLIYQLPMIINEGIGIVISPLISLMRDQINDLRDLEIPARTVDSTQSSIEKCEILNEIKNGDVKILYVSPEMFLANEIQEIIRDYKISYIAVDEAHCIPQWGEDFRPTYLEFAKKLKSITNITKIALSGSLNKEQKQDLPDIIGLNNPKLFQSSVARTNIKINILKKQNEYETEDLRKLITSRLDDTGIVYFNSKKKLEALFAAFRSEGLNVLRYHADLPHHEKADTLAKFMDDQPSIVFATIAFGMGVNKANVRYVVHLDAPNSVSNYYQEIGRAGRDGLSADAYMYFDYSEVIKRKNMLKVALADNPENKEKIKDLHQIISVAMTPECRVVKLSKHLDDESAPCNICDNCKNKEKLSTAGNVVRSIFNLLKSISLSESDLCKILGGKLSKREKLKFGEYNEFSEYKWIQKGTLQSIIRQLIALDILSISDEDYKSIEIAYRGLIIDNATSHDTIKLFLPDDIFNKNEPKLQNTLTQKYQDFSEYLRSNKIIITTEQMESTFESLQAKQPNDVFLSLNDNHQKEILDLLSVSLSSEITSFNLDM